MRMCCRAHHACATVIFCPGSGYTGPPVLSHGSCHIIDSSFRFVVRAWWERLRLSRIATNYHPSRFGVPEGETPASSIVWSHLRSRSEAGDSRRQIVPMNRYLRWQKEFTFDFNRVIIHIMYLYNTRDAGQSVAVCHKSSIPLVMREGGRASPSSRSDVVSTSVIFALDMGIKWAANGQARQRQFAQFPRVSATMAPKFHFFFFIIYVWDIGKNYSFACVTLRERTVQE